MKSAVRAALRSGVWADMAARLISARRFARLSQKDLGRRVGLSRAQLATIEQTRVPLRFWPGWKICRELNISQVWLMTGQGNMSPFLDLDLEGAEVTLGERELFRDICRFVLAHRLNVRAQETHALVDAPKGASTGAPPLDNDMVAYKRNRILRLRDQADSLLREVDRLQREIEPAGISKLSVDTTLASGRLASVKPDIGYWEALVTKVRAKTSAPGAKAQLARDLNTTRQAVNKWLSGKGAPSAEITLRLLEWVESPAQKQKRPDGATIAARVEKTRVPRSKNETKPQVRKRR